MKAICTGIEIDGTVKLINTTYAALTMGATECCSVTLRLANAGSATATIAVWYGDSASDNTRLLESFELIDDGGLVILAPISLGPSQSIYVESDTIGLIAASDGYYANVYQDHVSASFSIDGTTYAIDTQYTLLSASANDSYHGTLRISNLNTTIASVRVWRGVTSTLGNSDLIAYDLKLYPGDLIIMDDVVFGSTAASEIAVRSDTTDVVFFFDGFQEEG